MSAEPDKFFVGVVDLFSVILPGAALCYAVHLRPEMLTWLLPEYTGFKLAEYEGGAVFLVSSYVLGHFIFLFGALLDAQLYERLRQASAWNQQCRKDEGAKPAWTFTRWLARRLFGANPDQALVRVLELKQAQVPDINGRPVVNAFQWSKARLAVLSPSGLSEIQRVEADSKFFRSFSVVLFILMMATGLQTLRNPGLLPLLFVSCGFLLLTLWRYVERRFKTTQLAYWHLITLLSSDPVSPPKRE